ncbi:MAG: hypothetical protein Q4F67_13230 [Propionibacteriaceae bacterium]|nr:hypothetical protein [Propionibacteriaceae bacterium]
MLRARRALAAVAAVALLSACGGGTGDVSGGEVTEPEALPAEPAPTATATPLATTSPTPYAGPTGAADYADLELTADGFGPMRLGMTAAEGQDGGWVERLPHCDRWGASAKLRAEGVDLVFDDQDHLAEIWLGNSIHPTVEGARVGMPMEEIAYFYGDDLDYELRDSVSGSMYVPFVRFGEFELAFYALGDENSIPGPRAPVSGIGARAYGKDIERPSC